MVAAGIFSLHGLAVIYAFVTRNKQGGISEGFLAVAFIGIIFSVGWTILTMVTGLVLEPQGLAEWFNRDDATLTLLTICEGVFYAFYLRSNGKGVSENDDEGGAST
jgi:xanthine/uracil/vitamin C permease (AzgA family)